jgi:choline dehydrogenase-like flavoprotein
VPLEENRLRGLGGTTGLWAGWCRPLDPIDFAHRPWVPHSGWPITWEELQPYYAQAQPLLQLGPFCYDAGYWSRKLHAPLLPLDPARAVSKVYQLGPPTRFGTVYRRELAQARAVRVLLHATALELELADSGGTIRAVVAGCLTGTRWRVRSRLVVLAMGGIECARLLLLSSRQRPAGVGNEHDLVGRFFMEHIHFDGGELALRRPGVATAGLYDQTWRPVVARLFLPDQVQQAEELLHHNAMLEPLFAPEHQRAVQWVRNSLLRLRRRAIVYPQVCQGLAATAPLAQSVARRMARLSGRMPAFGRARLRFTLEQTPNPDSRVLLSDQRDAFGLPRARLHWQMAPADRTTYEQTRALLGAAFAQAGIGDLAEPAAAPHSWPPPPVQGMYGHHMGTVRMGADPRHGVVDANCRLHSAPNLYVASSAVFATSGSGVPTYTIVALALRLADHIKRLYAR